MSFSECLTKFLVGGALVLIVNIVARQGNGTVAGVIALFPVITAVSFYFMAKHTDVTVVRSAIISSALAIPTVLGFLVSLYYLSNKYGITISIIISFCVWFIIAVLYVLLRNILTN